MAKLLIKESSVREELLRMASSRTLHSGEPRFTRVSKDVLLALDRMLRFEMERLVRQHPSSGRTIYL